MNKYEYVVLIIIILLSSYVVGGKFSTIDEQLYLSHMSVCQLHLI